MTDKKIDQSSAITNRLKKMFGFGINPEAEKIENKIDIIKTVKGVDEKNKPFERMQTEKFPNDVKELWRYWMSGCHDEANDSWVNMLSVYDDCDLLFFNCAPITKSMEIMTDEVLQADSNNQIIFVEAKEKVKKYIEKFFDDINLNELLRPTVADIVQYGNAGWVLGFDNVGVNEIKRIPIRYLKERMEFSPVDLHAALMDSQHKLHDYRNSISSVNDLIDMIQNKKNSASYFKEYLLGFVVEDKVLPPWKFLHFRNITNKSPFAPFGIPTFIHAMAPYRQYDAAMAMQIIARGAMFPKQIYKLDLPNIVSPTEKFAKATEFLNEMLNSGFGTSKKELPGIGDIIVTIKDLFEYEQIAADIELKGIDDIELLKDDIYNACLLPRKLIDPSDSSFGESGTSYVEQFKPFARLIYRFQSILLNNISQLIKIHLIHTGEFELDEIEFSLSMPYPESQTNNDLISAQSSLLDLANNVIVALEDRVTGGEKLPPELIKTIYNKFLPYDSQVVDFWVDESLRAKEAGKTIPDEEEGFGDEPEDDISLDDSGNLDADGNLVDEGPEMNEEGKYSLKERQRRGRKTWRLLERKLGRRKLKETVDDISFECFMESSLREGSMRGQHFFKSKNKYSDFNLNDFVEVRKKGVTRLREEFEKIEMEVESIEEREILKEQVTKERKLTDKYEEYIFGQKNDVEDLIDK